MFGPMVEISFINHIFSITDKLYVLGDTIQVLRFNTGFRDVWLDYGAFVVLEVFV